MAKRYKGIARYVHMIKPSAPKGTDKLKWSLNILIHKNDPQCAVITAEIEAAKKNGFPSGFPANGDVNWNDLAITEPENTAVRDYMCFKASQRIDDEKPHFINQNGKSFISPGDDSSATGKVVYIEAYVTSYELGSGGVKAYLNGVLVTDELGPIPVEALSSKPSAKNMFADVLGGVATPAPAPTPAPTPNAAPAPPAPNTAPAPQYIMTDKAQGTREWYLSTPGWTDELLISNGLMIAPSFA